MPRVHSTYVPPTGPAGTDVMVVGEAPGKTEEREKEPFVGKSGSLLRDYLERNGFRVEEVFLTNLSKYRPGKNSFKKLRDTRELEEGIAELKEEIETVDPNLIIAVGNWPMYYLTGCQGKNPGSGITNWRGSVMPCTLVEGYKVVMTYHPAAVLRQWTWHPVFDFDLQYAKKQSAFPEIRRPEYEMHLAGHNPDHECWISDSEAEGLVAEMHEADWLEVDIETFRDNTMSCCGFADSANRTFVVTFQREGGWQWVKALLESPARKIFQFGTYDSVFLERFYNFEPATYRMEYEAWNGSGAPEIRNVGWDTYIAAATLMPEFPRGLDFLASVYTDFPYYKEDRKEWRKDYDLDTLWRYNAKDNIAEYIVAAKQMQEMSEMWDFEVPSQLAEV